MNKNWDDADHLTTNQIQDRLHDMSGDKCIVCNGLIEHHTHWAAKEHLKILCNWASPRKNYIRIFIFGVGIGVSIMALIRFLS